MVNLATETTNAAVMVVVAELLRLVFIATETQTAMWVAEALNLPAEPVQIVGLRRQAKQESVAMHGLDAVVTLAVAAAAVGLAVAAVPIMVAVVAAPAMPIPT